MINSGSKLSIWWLAGLVSLMLFLSACDLPRVSAEERLFLNLSLDFLGDYELPKTSFQNTPVGGLSGITYDRSHDRFYAISDDRSDLAPARFYTLRLELDTAAPSVPRIRQVNVEKVTLLQQEDGKPYPKGAIDPEGIALSPLGTLFISSEGVARDAIPPFVNEFDPGTGQWKRSLSIPTRYVPEIQDAQQTRGVRDNLGFEALTLSPGGYGNTAVEPFRLFTATESALAQDNDLAPLEQGATKNRMLHYVMEKERALLLAEHIYLLDPPPPGAQYHGLTELLAIDQGGHFLSLERSLGEQGFGVKLFQISTGTATDTSTISSLKGALRGIQPVRKRLLLDLSTLNVPLDNLEGMTLGPRLPDGSQSLILMSDDNFSPRQKNQFLLMRIRGRGFNL
jgi:hypothetical protein